MANHHSLWDWRNRWIWSFRVWFWACEAGVKSISRNKASRGPFVTNHREVFVVPAVFPPNRSHPNPHPASSPRRGLRVRRAPSRPPRSPLFRRLLCLSSSGSAAKWSWSTTSFISDLVLLSCDGLRPILVHDDHPEIDSSLLRLVTRNTNLADFVVQGSI